MLYQIISPSITQEIYGDSYKEAVKNFVKINYALKIRDLVIQNEMKSYNARVKYYQQENKDKISISMYPNNGIVPIMKQTPGGQVLAGEIVTPRFYSNLASLNQPLRNLKPVRVKPIVSSPGMVSANEDGAIIPVTSFITI